MHDQFETYVRAVQVTEKFTFFKYRRDVDSSVNIRVEVTRAISSIARKAKRARQRAGGRDSLKSSADGAEGCAPVKRRETRKAKRGCESEELPFA